MSGFAPIKRGHLAAIVTTLEMREKPRPRAFPAAPFQLKRWHAPTLDKYRTLFRRVGEPWLWYSRLIIPDDQLAAIIHDTKVEIYAVVDGQGIEVGILELDFREAGQCEIGFLGLIPELAGQGHGRWLMGQALMLAWRPGVERVWLHTCTLDHPRALGFYRAQGFTPFARALESFPDPRISGHLPREAAPQIPLIEA